jgi:hypothetical protein
MVQMGKYDVKSSFGPAKNQGNAMAQLILKENGKVVPCLNL